MIKISDYFKLCWCSFGYNFNSKEIQSQINKSIFVFQSVETLFMTDKPTQAEALKKLEYYCSYQERCHFEVEQKLFSFELTALERQHIIVHLIEHNYLNEERFAKLYTMSKLHQKNWGIVRIKNELKARKISDYLINLSLKEIPEEEYQQTFETLAEKYWNTIEAKNIFKKRKQFCDYMMRNGWESDLIYAKAKALESS